MIADSSCREVLRLVLLTFWKSNEPRAGAYGICDVLERWHCPKIRQSGQIVRFGAKNGPSIKPCHHNWSFTWTIWSLGQWEPSPNGQIEEFTETMQHKDEKQLFTAVDPGGKHA